MLKEYPHIFIPNFSIVEEVEFKPYKHSDETKNKIRESALGRIVSEETKQKIGLKLKGSIKTITTRQKMSESAKNKPPISEKTREKLKKSVKERLEKLGHGYGYKDGRSLKSTYQKERLKKSRNEALLTLGGKCIKCGFSDSRALQIDHINGGGSKERKEKNFIGEFHKHVLKSFLENENKYQLLCANCNWIKKVENKENKWH